MQEDFTLAWSGPMGERSNFPAFGQNPGHEETGDAADVGTWKPTFFHSQRSGKPLALSRTQTGVSLLYDEMASEDFNAPAAKGTVDEPTEAVGGFGGRMTSKAKKSYEAMARARDKISAEDPVIKTMNNSWCMNILAKVWIPAGVRAVSAGDDACGGETPERAH